MPRFLFLAGLTVGTLMANPPGKGPAAPVLPDSLPMVQGEDLGGGPAGPEITSILGETWPEGLRITMEGTGFGQTPHVAWRDGEERPWTPVPAFVRIPTGDGDRQQLWFSAPPHDAGRVIFRVAVEGRDEAQIPYIYQTSTLPRPQPAPAPAGAGAGWKGPVPFRAGNTITRAEKAAITAYTVWCRQREREGRKQGVPWAVIASRCRVDARCLRRYTYGLLPKAEYRTHSEEERAEGLRYYRRHRMKRSMYLIAKDLDVSKSTLENWVAGARDSSRRHRVGTSLGERDFMAAEALEAVELGETLSEYARRNNIPISTLQDWVNAYKGRYPDLASE